MAAINVKHTKVYKLAFELAMEIYEISKKFPKEETYSLTDQIRRSSRSVCICLLEAYRKKKYPAHFVSKVTDSDMETPKLQDGLILLWPVSILMILYIAGLQQKTRK